VYQVPVVQLQGPSRSNTQITLHTKVGAFYLCQKLLGLTQRQSSTETKVLKCSGGFLTLFTAAAGQRLVDLCAASSTTAQQWA
jgi:hypothetical protein